MPLEKTSVFVLFVPITEILPLYGSLVFVLPDRARIIVTLLVLVKANSGIPRFTRELLDALFVLLKASGTDKINWFVCHSKIV